MDLDIVITALRLRCPSYSSRIAGAARFQILPEASKLAVPQAFVIPLDDSPSESRANNAQRQSMTDSFAVIVAISNVPDEKGQAATATVRTQRTELWKALLGWQPTDEYNGINYEGGHLLQIDRARLWYQFEFGADMEIGPTDGYEETALAGLPAFEGATINVDVIDPAADPNVQYPGPDGRIEFEVAVPQGGGDLPA